VFAGDAPASPESKWTAFQGLAEPESAYYDAPSGNLFVSNVAGKPGEKDGKGWISKLTIDGKVVAEKWIDGLHAPKGLRVWNTTLWVSDIDELIGISIPDGKIAQRVKIEGAKFLNDVATQPDGTVYVTDMFASKIYAVKDGKAEVFSEGDNLESPNGIVIDTAGNRMIVAAWGLTTDGKTQTPGHLYQLDLKTKEKKLITPAPLGNLDGVELDGQGGYIVSDWVAGKVFHVDAEGKAQNILKFQQGSADVHYIPEMSLLIVPVMPEGVVGAFGFKPVK
jgi:DNA-binding beta-propeller fold protein YncE